MKKVTAVLVVAGMVLGLAVHFHAPREIASPPNLTRRTSPDTTPPSAASSAPAPPGIPWTPAPSVPPAPTSAKTVDAEIALPLPPSGDFELTLTAAQISAIVERRYGAFFLSLSLPPDRLVRLRSLLIERQQVTIDAANAALLFGLNPVRDLPVIQRAIQEFQTAVDTKLREEFGDAAFTAYRDFDLTLRERNSVGDFAQRLAATAEPLRPEQEKELLLLLKNSPAEEISRNIDQAIFGGLNERAPITKETIASAARVLSPRQLEIFQTLQQPP